MNRQPTTHARRPDEAHAQLWTAAEKLRDPRPGVKRAYDGAVGSTAPLPGLVVEGLAGGAGSSFLTHFGGNVTTTGSLSTADDVASLGGFVIEMLIVVAAMVVAARQPVTPARL